MFVESLTYPRSGTDAAKTILIGGILTVFGVLLVPLLLVGGYSVRVVRSVLAGEERPPAFEAWGELFVDGVKAVAVFVAYVALPTVVLVATVILTALTFDAGLGGRLVAGGLALVGLSVAGVLYLACWYVGTAGFVNFAKTGELGAAFAVGDLRPVLTSGAYATAWLLALVVLVGSSIVVGALEVVPVVGWVIGGFVTFYASVSTTYLYARGFADATDVEPAPEQPAGQPAA